MSAAADATSALRRVARALLQPVETAGRIIVGHTTEDSARIWVRGSSHYPVVQVRVERTDPAASEPAVEDERTVDEHRDYTACFDVHRLEPSSGYQVVAAFKEQIGSGPAGATATAVFRTFPRLDDPEARSFSFLLGSCNLSVVAINNLAAQALQLVGFYLARRSLERPVSERHSPGARAGSWRTRVGRWLMRWRVVRRGLGWLMEVSLASVFLGTGGKWSRQPLLTSPFLKLAGMFAGYRVVFRHGHRAPQVGDLLIGATSGETAVLAFPPVVESGRWCCPDSEGERQECGAAGFMVLTDTAGRFEAQEWLRIVRDDRETGAAPPGPLVAQVGAVTPLTPDLGPPAFTLHVGDQIYYDFPNARRAPELDSYRETYRERWFEDRFQRFFLARGSHYMAIDDHELVDGFASDLDLPEDGGSAKPSAPPPANRRFEAESYLAAALPAYQEYVHSRHPDGPLYYDFRHGAARFFVLDTRTERRRDSRSQMIDGDQMMAFQDWLASAPSDLKFVVSSVPFVAEVVQPRQTIVGQSGERDKWCHRPFRWQRDEIIEFIESAKIERVVFLVGDMHCAYHASMAIGGGHRWTRRMVHELAGGPIAQLEFSRQEQFARTIDLATRGEGLPYQVRMHQFHGNASAVMHIEVSQAADLRDPGGPVPEIVWRVIRTMTEPEPPVAAEQATTLGPEPAGQIRDHPPIAGRITLVRRRGIDELRLW